MKSTLLENTLKPADIVHKASQQRSLSEDSRPFAQRYPLASLLVFLASTIAPDFFLSVALATPLVRFTLSLQTFVTIVLIWWLTFLSPSDLFNRVTSHKMFRVVVDVLIEVNRKRTFARIVEMTMKKSFLGSQFSAVLVAGFYCLLFKLTLLPLDQLMRGETVAQHEAKTPGQSTFTVFAYAVASFLFYYTREIDTYPISLFTPVSIETVYRSIMVVAILMSIFKHLTGCNPFMKACSLPCRFMQKGKESPPVKRAREPVKAEEEEEEEPVLVETPKKSRGPARKRRSSKPNI